MTEPIASAVKIVLVDDDEEFRPLVRYILLAGLREMVVVEAADGEARWALVRRERPDIVITDLVMPRLDGVGLTQRIRAEFPQTSIILMSSFTEDAYRMMASDSGADAFVSKQVIENALIPAIMDVISRRFSAGRGPIPPDGASAAPCSK
jgi:DNA-binding NarL/FixJ family response regulator